MFPSLHFVVNKLVDVMSETALSSRQGYAQIWKGIPLF